MKIICSKEFIRKGFHAVENVISGSNINPMLQNVRIIANNNTLELSTTDMEVSVSYLIDSVEVITPGKMIGPEIQISSIVKEWTEETIEITEEDKKCVIKGKDNFFKIFCSDPEGFPTIPKFIEEEYIEIDKNVLLDMIKKTAFIILGDRTKHGTSGIFLDISDNQIKMVTNDGRRLSEVKKKINNPHSISKNCIIPIKGILQMQRIAGEQEEDLIKLRIEEKRIFIKTKHSTLCSQLLEGQYPKYEEVIPTNLDKKIYMDRNQFSSAIRRVSIMTTEEYKLLRFKFSGEILEIRCLSPDVGESKTEIPIEYSGEDMEIGLNPEFLLDYLKNVDCDRILLELKDQGTAGKLKVGTGCIYVVMPMSLGEE
ncbi:DNA polymerase III beta subunit [Candidatus Scalindua japonica]|uniref:Beta sliding clamp n=1 Tax=Candidatus Scalindua japonica TaxID=1284222 RepID=A0A286U0M8_9BACT|nr:DNA polymerase III subunit beta [Candidatus Scalindua japonica]GAX61676.1 DNA polymerase III beta subunit [Candidatus Scalindua japonica]